VNLDALLLKVSHKTALSDAAGTADRLFLVGAVNEGIRQVLQDTRCKVTAVTFSLVAGTSEYDLQTALSGDEILAVVDYTNPTDNRTSLSIAPTAEVLARRLQGATGAARRFALLGGNLIIVNPTPTENGTATFYAVTKATDLTTSQGSTSLDTYIPVYAQYALEAWVCKEAAQKNKDLNGVGYFQSEYDKEVIKIRKRGRWLGGRRLPPGNIGYPDAPNTPLHDNSSDLNYY
jgi:hypothetical protein